MPQSATQRLSQRLDNATFSRQDRELASDRVQGGNIQGKVIKTDANGTQVQTSNGGKLRVRNTGRTPATGEVVQTSVSPSGGKAQINKAPIISAPNGLVTKLGNIRYKRTAPVVGEDFGRFGDLWLDYSPEPAAGVPQGELYAWLPTAGHYAKVGGNSGPGVTYSPNPPEYDPIDPINNPPPGNPSDGHIWVDTTVNRQWRYRAETNTYYNISGALHFTRQVPGMSNPDRFVRGDRLTLADTINEGKYCEYEFRPPGGTEPTGTSSDWRLITCCDSCPDDIPDGSCDEGLWQHNGSGQWFCCTTPSNQDIFSS